jgi:hypothetical protein
MAAIISTPLLPVAASSPITWLKTLASAAGSCASPSATMVSVVRWRASDCWAAAPAGSRAANAPSIKSRMIIFFMVTGA